VDEASDQRSAGSIGQCKNAAAYRYVVLLDPEGRKAMQVLRRFVGSTSDPNMLVFRSKRGGPLRNHDPKPRSTPGVKSVGVGTRGYARFP